MATVNIRRDVDDAFYRYKMPKLISKVEGKGNGIKTVIPNMSDIGKSLYRPPAYPTKFFGCELGAQVKCDEKNDRYIVNGAHDAPKLQQLLDVFIQKFVLCPSCKNPETDLIIGKDGHIQRDCKACGKRNPVDMGHRLTTFIIKNPPNGSGGGKGSKKDKKAAKAKKGTSTTAPIPSNGGAPIPTPPDTASNDSADDDEDQLTKRIRAEAADLPDAEFDDDEWCEDTSEHAVKERMKELQGAVTNMAITPTEMLSNHNNNNEDDDDDGLDDPLEIFAEYVTSHLDAPIEDITNHSFSLSIPAHRAACVLPQVLFNAKNILTDIPLRSPLLHAFVKNSKAQKSLLGGMERLVGVVHPQLLPKTSLILKGLYDEDLVDEEVLLEWGKKPSKKYVDKEVSKEVRKHAAVFLKWLEEADEEESSEEK